MTAEGSSRPAVVRPKPGTVAEVRRVCHLVKSEPSNAPAEPMTSRCGERFELAQVDLLEWISDATCVTCLSATGPLGSSGRAEALRSVLPGLQGKDGPVAVGEYVLRARRLSNLSSELTAELAGTSKLHLKMVESGAAQLTRVPLIVSLAAVLRRPPEELALTALRSYMESGCFSAIRARTVSTSVVNPMTEPKAVAVGVHLGRMRRLLRIPLMEAAERAGVTPSALAGLERGERLLPELPQIVSLAKALGERPDEYILMALRDYPVSPETIELIGQVRRAALSISPGQRRNSLRGSRPLLVEARRRVPLTQEGLAKLLGVHAMTVGKWENGDATPRQKIRGALAKALRVSDNDLSTFLFGGQPWRIPTD